MVDKMHRFMMKAAYGAAFLLIPAITTFIFETIWDPSPLNIKLLLTFIVSFGVCMCTIYLDYKYKEAQDEKEV